MKIEEYEKVKNLDATGRSIDLLKTSYNEKFLLWINNKNVKLFKEFDKL